ncbi:MAG: Rpn family recombination-promoting nuclease/putative transposase [Magnetococcales bacterium]|nr:Rpn family recombination-promoting nuclease/putative transposase [Magnetococcales bacterium]
MSKIAHPHDRFLKILLSDPERAASLLRERIPVEMSEWLSDADIGLEMLQKQRFEIVLPAFSSPFLHFSFIFSFIR